MLKKLMDNFLGSVINRFLWGWGLGALAPTVACVLAHHGSLQEVVDCLGKTQVLGSNGSALITGLLLGGVKGLKFDPEKAKKASP